MYHLLVPSSYNAVKDKQLEDAGFNIVIYANHMLEPRICDAKSRLGNLKMVEHMSLKNLS